MEKKLVKKPEHLDDLPKLEEIDTEKLSEEEEVKVIIDKIEKIIDEEEKE